MTNRFAFPAVLNTNSNGKDSVTAFNPDAENPVFVADSFHPHFDAILHGLEWGDPGVWALFSVGAGIASRFNTITDRVSWNGKSILWDGDVVHSVLAEQLERAIAHGDPDNYIALAKFWEKLESNPSDHSRTQAYDWLACHKFQITPEGDVVGYKGVHSGTEEGTFLSSWASQVAGKPSAFVNGLPVPELSQVPQKVGDIVTMPRSEVVHDPREACRRGLHVATRNYIGYSYGGNLLEVHVNPRDIVSVPTDGQGAKVRVCRYEVARIAVPENEMSTAPVLKDVPENVWAGDVGYNPDDY